MFMIKTQTSKYSIKRWRIDEENEVANKQFKKFFDEHDIEWKLSASYAKKQIDITKRKNLIVMKCVKVILIDVDLSNNFWNEILLTVVYLKNKTSVARLRL